MGDAGTTPNLCRSLRSKQLDHLETWRFMIPDFPNVWRGVLLAPPSMKAAIGRALGHAFSARPRQEGSAEFHHILDRPSAEPPQ